MKPTYYGVFKVDTRDGRGLLLVRTKPTYEEAEASINIPADMLSDVTYTILPLYSNRAETK